MTQTRLDRAAALLSGLCVVHCFASAAALSLLASLGPVLGHGFHVVGLALAAPLAAFALLRAWRLHHRVLPIVLGTAGIALMLAGVAEDGRWQEFALTAPGAALLVAAHLTNLRLMRATGGCSHRARTA